MKVWISSVTGINMEQFDQDLPQFASGYKPHHVLGIFKAMVRNYSDPRSQGNALVCDSPGPRAFGLWAGQAGF
jgi:hypothetical protein